MSAPEPHGLQRADLSMLRILPAGRGPRMSPRAVDDKIPLTLCYGTDSYDDPWACDDESAYAKTIAQRGFFPLRARPLKVGGSPEPLRPYAGLEGIKPWGNRQIWISWGYTVYYFMEDVPEHLRHVVAHSHAGQAIWFLAAAGFRFQSVTFVGTPNRTDVPIEEALPNIGFAQIIYDSRWDKMAFLGGFFDRSVNTDRSYKQLGDKIRRYPIDKIDHSKVLRDPDKVKLWLTEPWLSNIRIAASLT